MIFQNGINTLLKVLYLFVLWRKSILIVHINAVERKSNELFKFRHHLVHHNILRGTKPETGNLKVTVLSHVRICRIKGI